MERDQFEIIQELMDELKSTMAYSEEDFASRLGREKPEVEVVKMEGKLPLGDDLEGAMHEMEEEAEFEESPEDKLKSRLMKLRG